jgi:hypothetical protein
MHVSLVGVAGLNPRPPSLGSGDMTAFEFDVHITDCDAAGDPEALVRVDSHRKYASSGRPISSASFNERCAEDNVRPQRTLT